MGSGETKLHGIKKLNDDIRWYAAVACVATYVPEAFMLEVAEDDRVCRRIEELERTTFEELEYISTFLLMCGSAWPVLPSLLCGRTL